MRYAFLDRKQSAYSRHTVPLSGFFNFDGDDCKNRYPLFDGEISAEERLEKEETILETREILKTLQKPHRDVLTLCDMNGKSYAEAAAILRIYVSTVRSRLHRARENFKQKYKFKQMRKCLPLP
jgi:RNA polymerase sigma factor (sigma-70 family)